MHISEQSCLIMSKSQSTRYDAMCRLSITMEHCTLRNMECISAPAPNIMYNYTQAMQYTYIHTYIHTKMYHLRVSQNDTLTKCYFCSLFHSKPASQFCPACLSSIDQSWPMMWTWDNCLSSIFFLNLGSVSKLSLGYEVRNPLNAVWEQSQKTSQLHHWSW
jgi:hypothetical protein